MGTERPKWKLLRFMCLFSLTIRDDSDIKGLLMSTDYTECGKAIQPETAIGKRIRNISRVADLKNLISPLLHVVVVCFLSC